MIVHSLLIRKAQWYLSADEETHHPARRRQTLYHHPCCRRIFCTATSIVRSPSLLPLARLDIISLHHTAAVSFDESAVLDRRKAHSPTLSSTRCKMRSVRTLQQPDSTNPLPHSSNIASPSFPHHRPDIRVALDFLLYPLPQLLSSRCTEFISQHIISQLCNTHVVLPVHIRLACVQSSLVAQLLQRHARKFFRLLLHLVARCNSITSIASTTKQ